MKQVFYVKILDYQIPMVYRGIKDYADVAQSVEQRIRNA